MADLKPGFEKMEAQKADLMRGLASLDAETLNRQPEPGAWSILQVIAHLTKSEGGTLQYIKKKTQDPQALPKTGVVPWLRIGVLIVGIHSPFKFKAPKAIADVPETGRLPGRESRVGRGAGGLARVRGCVSRGLERSNDLPPPVRGPARSGADHDLPERASGESHPPDRPDPQDSGRVAALRGG